MYARLRPAAARADHPVLVLQLERHRRRRAGWAWTTTSRCSPTPTCSRSIVQRVRPDRLLQLHPGRARARMAATIRRIAAEPFGAGRRGPCSSCRRSSRWWRPASRGAGCCPRPVWSTRCSRAIGLGGVTRAWLGDFDTALPAVGVIGAWVLLGLCTLLLLAGMSKIDPALYEAARLDGAGPVREFFADHPAQPAPGDRRLRHGDHHRRPGQLRHRLHLHAAAVPATATMVPGLEIYCLAFSQRQVGLASALAVVLMVLVLACVLPIQRLTEGRSSMIVSRRETLTGRASCSSCSWRSPCCRSSACSRRRCSRGHRTRAGWPGRRTRSGAISPTPSTAAHMGELLRSSVLIVAGVVPVSVLIATMAGFAFGQLRMPGRPDRVPGLRCSA